MTAKKTNKPNLSEGKSALDILHQRFQANPHRHPNVDWSEVESLIINNKKASEALEWMESTGGEPDIVVFGDEKMQLIDCSPETPSGRRSLCYDMEALEKRKNHKPEGAAVETAQENGTTLLTEEEYFSLQKIQAVDQKTSSWLDTPTDIRKLGGALFGDRRFGRVFVYHNGAESYYGVRGFRVKFPL